MERYTLGLYLRRMHPLIFRSTGLRSTLSLPALSYVTPTHTHLQASIVTETKEIEHNYCTEEGESYMERDGVTRVA